MLPVASSSHRGPKDPSPKAEVNESERTVCFRKPSSSSLGVQDDYACEIEIRINPSRSSSEESENSAGSSSVNNNMEYRRLNSSNDSPEEDPPSPPEPSPSRVVNIPDIPERPQQKDNQCNPQQTPWRECMDTYTDWSLKIIYSGTLFPMYVILMGFTAQAAYMGASHGNDCPFLTDGPTILFLMGLTGFGALLFQLFSILQKHSLHDNSDCLSATQTTSFVFSVFYLGTFGIVLDRFMSAKGLPSNIHGPHYCDIHFYGYVCWTIYSFSMLTVLLFIVLAPPFFIYAFIHGKS